MWLTLPSFLASASYTSPASSTQTAFQEAHKTDLAPFAWAATRPKYMHDFAQWMAAQREEHELWFKAFMPEEIIYDGTNAEVNGHDSVAEEDRVLFVDIGGGLGHQCRALRSFLPWTLPTGNKILYQDLPTVIALADGSIDGVEAMVHDIFKPQPVISQSPLSSALTSLTYFAPRCQILLHA